MSNDKKQSWEMTYEELFDAWAERYAFGSKGEMSLSEAREIHKKWMRLGKEASAGF